jgi:transcription antitermination factor NusG
MQLDPRETENGVAGPLHDWYAAYVKHHHEKKAAGLLESKGLEVFLPTQLSVRKWKDRRTTLSLPLFPGYLFLRCSLEHKFNILNTPGVFFLVESNGRPCAIAPEEIENLRRVVVSGAPAQSYPYISTGDRVRIRSGSLADVHGILIRFKNQYRVVLAVELLRKAISVEVETDNVEPVRGAARAVANGLSKSATT